MNLPPNFTVERPSATTTIRAEQAASDGSGFQRAIRAAAMFAPPICRRSRRNA
jgi:hypothetical protein